MQNYTLKKHVTPSTNTASTTDDIVVNLNKINFKNETPKHLFSCNNENYSLYTNSLTR